MKIIHRDRLCGYHYSNGISYSFLYLILTYIVFQVMLDRENYIEEFGVSSFWGVFVIYFLLGISSYILCYTLFTSGCSEIKFSEDRISVRLPNGLKMKEYIFLPQDIQEIRHITSWSFVLFLKSGEQKKISLLVPTFNQSPDWLHPARPWPSNGLVERLCQSKNVYGVTFTLAKTFNIPLFDKKERQLYPE